MFDKLSLKEALLCSTLSTVLTSAVLIPVIKSNSGKKAYYQGKIEGYELSRMCNKMEQELEDMRIRLHALER